MVFFVPLVGKGFQHFSASSACSAVGAAWSGEVRLAWAGTTRLGLRPYAILKSVERSRDWWIQAQADLAHAKAALSIHHFDWACFAAHQAAEKAVKAVFERRGEKAAGHSVRYLLSAVTEREVAPELLSAAKVLDKHSHPVPQRPRAGGPH